MITFAMSIILLIIGYFTYVMFVERIFGVKPDRPTPAYSEQDGVDYVPMGTKRNSLIQLL
ncbi:carbon starvation protein A, partial [Flavobacterium sp. IR1]